MDAITPGAQIAEGRSNVVTGWTDERVQILKAEWGLGSSCSQIAVLLGGVTRNAVIGKLSRLGLTHRPRSRSTRAAKQHRPRPDIMKARLAERMRAKPVPPTRAGRIIRQAELDAMRAEDEQAVSAPMVFNPAHRVTFMQLQNHHCRFPLWTDGDKTEERFYCGSPTASLIRRQPYCRAHAAISGRMYSATPEPTPKAA